MNLFDRLVAYVAPGAARERMRARVQLAAMGKALAHYDAASAGRRTGSLRASGADADAAAGQRRRIAQVARDLVRNMPHAARAQQVIANNVVGDGIVPRIAVDRDAAARLGVRVTERVAQQLRGDGLRMIEQVLDTTAIDDAGRQNLYGLQRLVVNTLVDAGEALIVARWQPAPFGPGRFPLKLRVLEPDYLDTSLDHVPVEGGGRVQGGIRYDAAGQRVAYRLYAEHPGSDQFIGTGARGASDWVPANDVLHIYRQDRAGQERGVSWLAPVVLTLLDFSEYQDAQILRQKIAAAFAGFRRVPDTVGPGAQGPRIDEIEAGAIYDLYGDEEITFSAPPEVSGYEEFTRVSLRSVASALGVTYEALTGDLSTVNFSSARMGRMEMDRNIAAWQWLLVIPQMLQPLAEWLRLAWALSDPRNAGAIRQAVRFDWVPPSRILVDPAREIPALNEAVRAGFTSRQAVVRGFGLDPERLLEEQEQDQAAADARGLVFTTDARVGAAGGASVPPGAAPAPDNTDTGPDAAERGQA